MNLKYYIRGIGVGILFTAVVMSAAFHVFSDKKLSDTQIKERAKELGMVESSSTDPLNDLLTTPTVTPTPTEAAVPTDAAAQPENSKEDSTQAGNSKKDDTQDTKEKEGTADTSKAGDTKETAGDSKDALASDKSAQIDITEGMTSEQVAKLLKDKGIVEDSDAFSQYLVINNYTKKIKTGKFQLNTFASYKSITDLIIDK